MLPGFVRSSTDGDALRLPVAPQERVPASLQSLSMRRFLVCHSSIARFQTQSPDFEGVSVPPSVW